MTTAPARTPDGPALSGNDAATVHAIVAGILPQARMAVFGSRATGHARPFSDLDLLFIDPPSLTWSQRAALRDAFEVSALPFRVDVVELDALPPGMRSRVLAEALPWAMA